MKTTKKWSKMLKLDAFAMVVAFGMVLASCGDNGGTGPRTDAEKLQGTWNNVDDTLPTVVLQFVCAGSNFTFKDSYDSGANFANSDKGTFVLDEATHTLTLAYTHRWNSGSWVARPASYSLPYYFTNDTTFVYTLSGRPVIFIKQ